MPLSCLPDEILALVCEHLWQPAQPFPVDVARAHWHIAALCGDAARYDAVLSHLLCPHRAGGRAAMRAAAAAYARAAEALARVASPPTRAHGVAYRVWMHDGSTLFLLFDDWEMWVWRGADERSLPRLLSKQLLSLVDVTRHGGLACVSSHRCVLAKCGGAAKARAAYAQMDPHTVFVLGRKVVVHWVERSPTRERMLLLPHLTA